MTKYEERIVIWQPSTDPLESTSFDVPGIYVIFQYPPTLGVHIVYVGQSEGSAYERAKDHLEEPQFKNRKYPDIPLYVTWTHIEDKETRNGIERWLGKKSRYKDKIEIGKRYPEDDPPIQVNHPRLTGQNGMLLTDALDNE